MASSLKDFKVLAQLGKGSYGSVMKVERIRDGGIYAMKEVNIRRLSPREREDAVNEIRILASIKSRNIVRYCDAFVERDNLYIIMEFAEGGDIGRQIEKFKKANKYIKEDTIWSYCIQICRALLEMHSRNILHRDLKPKNVFLTGKNHVRLGDLGCAKLMKTGLARTQIGTPYYMSPEIWNNRPYDSKSDIWALGCLLYELAMLVPPFLANDMNGLALKVKTTAPSRISKHYSDDLANLVASMLNKDPRMRPDVRQVLTHPAVTARLSSVPDGDDTAWAGDEMRTALLNTIKVPASFGVVPSARPGSGGLALPPASYPIQQAPASAAAAPAPSAAAPVAAPQMLRRADSAPELLGARPTTPPPASAAPVALARPSMVAMAGAGAPAPVAAPAPRVASFAAATSPPQLGRVGGLQRQGSAPDILQSNNQENAYAAQLKALAAAAGAGPLARPPSSAGMVAPVKPLVAVPSSRNVMMNVPAAPSSAAAGYAGAGLGGIAAAKAAVAAAAVPSRPPVPAAPVPSAYGAAAAAMKMPSAAVPSSVGAAGGLVKRPSFAVPSNVGAAGLYGAGARPSSAAGGIAPLYAAAPSAAAGAGMPRYSAMGAGLANAAAAGAAAAGGRHLMRGL